MKMKSEVVQSCLTISNPMDCSPSGSSVHGIFQARVLPEEIAENDFTLSVSTYVEQKDTREVVDIVKLNAEIEEIVKREDVLRAEIAEIIREIEGGDA